MKDRSKDPDLKHTLKKCTVQYAGQKKVVQGYLIESINDVKEFDKFMAIECMDGMSLLLDSREPLYRLDHEIGCFKNEPKRALAALAQVNAHVGKFGETNTIFQMPIAKNIYIKQLFDMCVKGDLPIFVNHNGGYCTIDNKVLTLIEKINDQSPSSR